MKKHTLIAVILVLAAWTAVPADADFRTRTVRLVPSQAWEPSPTAIRLSVQVTTGGEGAEEFATNMEQYLQAAFEKLDYTVREDASVAVDFTVDEFDKGKWIKRYLKGDGIVLGTIRISDGGQAVGEYRFSSRLRGGFAGTSVKMMAKEVGPPVVLKLTRGEEDDKLHGED